MSPNIRFEFRDAEPCPHLDDARCLLHDDERRLLARLDRRIIDSRTELEAMQELKD